MEDASQTNATTAGAQSTARQATPTGAPRSAATAGGEEKLEAATEVLNEQSAAAVADRLREHLAVERTRLSEARQALATCQLERDALRLQMFDVQRQVADVAKDNDTLRVAVAAEVAKRFASAASADLSQKYVAAAAAQAWEHAAAVHRWALAAVMESATSAAAHHRGSNSSAATSADVTRASGIFRGGTHANAVVTSARALEVYLQSRPPPPNDDDGPTAANAEEPLTSTVDTTVAMLRETVERLDEEKRAAIRIGRVLLHERDESTARCHVMQGYAAAFAERSQCDVDALMALRNAGPSCTTPNDDAVASKKSERGSQAVGAAGPHSTATDTIMAFVLRHTFVEAWRRECDRSLPSTATPSAGQFMRRWLQLCHDDVRHIGRTVKERGGGVVEEELSLLRPLERFREWLSRAMADPAQLEASHRIPSGPVVGNAPSASTSLFVTSLLSCPLVVADAATFDPAGGESRPPLRASTVGGVLSAALRRQPLTRQHDDASDDPPPRQHHHQIMCQYDDIPVEGVPAAGPPAGGVATGGVSNVTTTADNAPSPSRRPHPYEHDRSSSTVEATVAPANVAERENGERPPFRSAEASAISSASVHSSCSGAPLAASAHIVCGDREDACITAATLLIPDVIWRCALRHLLVTVTSVSGDAAPQPAGTPAHALGAAEVARTLHVWDQNSALELPETSARELREQLESITLVSAEQASALVDMRALMSEQLHQAWRACDDGVRSAWRSGTQYSPDVVDLFFCMHETPWTCQTCCHDLVPSVGMTWLHELCRHRSQLWPVDSDGTRIEECDSSAFAASLLEAVAARVSEYLSEQMAVSRHHQPAGCAGATTVKDPWRAHRRHPYAGGPHAWQPSAVTGPPPQHCDPHHHGNVSTLAVMDASVLFPRVIWLLPPSQFATFVRSVRFRDEALAYDAVMRYVREAPRLQVAVGEIKGMLDLVHYAWLPPAVLSEAVEDCDRLLSAATHVGVVVPSHSSSASPIAVLVASHLKGRLVAAMRIRVLCTGKGGGRAEGGDAAAADSDSSNWLHAETARAAFAVALQDALYCAAATRPDGSSIGDVRCSLDAVCGDNAFMASRGGIMAAGRVDPIDFRRWQIAIPDAA